MFIYLTMFEGNEHFGGQMQRFLLKTLLQCSQHCSHLGNDCPIRIVEGEADTKYKGKVLGHWLYNYTAGLYDVQYVVYMIYIMLYLYNV
jgi:hypothetical protein